MIPLTYLYDEYIDRPKFTEQKKKNPFEYIVPSPTSGVGTINHLASDYVLGMSVFFVVMQLHSVAVYVYVVRRELFEYGKSVHLNSVSGKKQRN